MKLRARCMCVAALAGWGVAALSVQGCGTPGDGAPSVRVTMVGDDQFQAGNRTARLAGLPGLLQGMGANRTTEVVIVVTPRCSPPAMAAIGGKLGAAGFRKVMFQKPRGATSYVGGRDTKERPK